MGESYYLDWAFVVNFCMDYLLLWLTGVALKRRSGVRRRCLGAAAGGLFACVGMLAYRGSWLRTILLVAGAVCICRLVFRSSGKQLFQDIIVFFGITFVFGGMLGSLEVQEGIWLLVFTVIAAMLLWGVLTYRKEYGKRQIYTIELALFGERIRCKALLDTGNNLYEPMHRRPVIVCEKGLLQELVTKGLGERPERFCIIPYCSVGKKEGILIGTELSELVIFREEGAIHQSGVIAALSDTITDAGEYQVILHPDLL